MCCGGEKSGESGFASAFPILVSVALNVIWERRDADRVGVDAELEQPWRLRV